MKSTLESGIRLAFLSDVHANFPALCSAVQSGERMGATYMCVAGDIVGRGPHPNEVIHFLRDIGIAAIRGNLDAKVLALRDKPQKARKLVKQKQSAVAWTALQLGSSEWEYLASLPEELNLDFNGLRIQIVHGSPLGNTDYVYPSVTLAGLRSKQAEGNTPDVLVCGHSHIPFIKKVGGVRVINCGSVGLPIDGDPRGSYAVFDVAPDASGRGRIVRFADPVENVVSDLHSRGVVGTTESYFTRGVGE